MRKWSVPPRGLNQGQEREVPVRSVSVITPRMGMWWDLAVPEARGQETGTLCLGRTPSPRPWTRLFSPGFTSSFEKADALLAALRNLRLPKFFKMDP